MDHEWGSCARGCCPQGTPAVRKALPEYLREMRRTEKPLSVGPRNAFWAVALVLSWALMAVLIGYVGMWALSLG